MTTVLELNQLFFFMLHKNRPRVMLNVVHAKSVLISHSKQVWCCVNEIILLVFNYTKCEFNLLHK
jgi:hypothetical protein